MRHKKSFNHLGRKSAHRKAMLSNMATSLILNKRIKTTVAKAKALRTYVEPLITKSKEDTTHSRRVVFSYLQNKEGVSELFREVAVKVANRQGGYTRIIKTGTRFGDNAEMCIMELVDYNELMLAEKETSATKTTKRSRRGSKKKPSTVVDNVEETKTQPTTGKTDEVVEDKIEVAKENKEEVTKEAEKIEKKEATIEKKQPEKKEEVKKEDKKVEPEAKVKVDKPKAVKEEKPQEKNEKKPEDSKE